MIVLRGGRTAVRRNIFLVPNSNALSLDVLLQGDIQPSSSGGFSVGGHILWLLQLQPVIQALSRKASLDHLTATKMSDNGNFSRGCMSNSH